MDSLAKMYWMEKSHQAPQPNPLITGEYPLFPPDITLQSDISTKNGLTLGEEGSVY
jgi:hypothetical protein